MVSVPEVRLGDAHHVLGGLDTQTEQLQHLAGFRGDLVDTPNSYYEGNFRLGRNVDVADLLGVVGFLYVQELLGVLGGPQQVLTTAEQLGDLQLAASPERTRSSDRFHLGDLQPGLGHGRQLFEGLLPLNGWRLGHRNRQHYWWKSGSNGSD